MIALSAGNRDTEPSAPKIADTVAASATDETAVSTGGDPGETPGPRIRPSSPAKPDYQDLIEVDPAHYAITREIARGGMGRIHIARDRRLGREVALKEVLVQSGVMARRFEREARITARLQHPSIVSVHEAGVWPSGEPFYAMRLVSGRSLDEAVAAATSFDQRIALLPHVLAIADAMAYAHGQRVIHRDLKPRNVVVGEFGETVVIDWGLAKEHDGGLASEPGQSDPAVSAGSTETVAGDVLGTPAYMPPEQATGGSVDERADVFAIGAILYHVLAGQPPYVGASSAEVLASVIAGPPRPIASAAPTAPTELGAIVERAMSRDLGARYPSARELADDLRRFQTGQLVGAHRYSLGQLVRRWLRRHRTAIVAVTAAAVVGLAIGVYAITRIVEANREVAEQREIAVGDRRNAEQLIQFMLGDLRTRLTQLGRLDLMDGVARKVAAYYNARGALESDAETLQLASARNALADVFSSRGDLASAEAQLGIEREELAAVVARDPTSVSARAQLSDAMFELVDIDIARGELARALATTTKELAADEDLLARAPAALPALKIACRANALTAKILTKQADVPGALARLRRVIELASPREREDSDLDHLLSGAHVGTGNVLSRSKFDQAGALAEYRLALGIAKNHVARDPKDVRWLSVEAEVLLDIGGVLLDFHDPAGARAELEASLDISTKLVAIEPRDVTYRYNMQRALERLGGVAFEQKDYPEALARYRKSYEIEAATAAEDPSNLDAQRQVSVLVNRLGDIELATNHPDKAVEYYRSALAVREQLVAKDPTNQKWRRDLFYSHNELVNALNRIPKHELEMLAELRVALALADQIAAASPANHAAQDDLAVAHERVAEMLAHLPAQGDWRKEIAAARAIADREAALPDASDDAKQLAVRLAQVASQLEKTARK